MIKQSFAEATVWKTKLPDVEHGLLPSSIPRPNPMVVGSTLIVSIFSPGAVCALKRDSGLLIWRRQLEGLGSASVFYRAGKLFAKTAHTLYALRPENGCDLWSFCPYGTEHEWIYSYPAVRANRLFIGDRRGLLHCLNADSGAAVWKVQTNRQGADVNSTPLLVDGLAIVGTNARTVVAFDMETGRRAWKRSIDGPAVFGLLRYMGSIVVVTDSIYLLSPSTGAIQRHIGSADWSIEYAEVVGANLWALLRDPSDAGRQRLVVCNTRGEKTIVITPKAMCPELRYVPKTRLAYLSHLHGVTLLDAKTNVLADFSVSTEGVGVVDV
jgi:outer membrane protein assembly factor BamB